MSNVAELCRRQGKSQEAEALFNQVLDMRRNILGPDHPNTTATMVTLGAMRLEQHAYQRDKEVAAARGCGCSMVVSFWKLQFTGAAP